MNQLQWFLVFRGVRVNILIGACEIRNDSINHYPYLTYSSIMVVRRLATVSPFSVTQYT